jgi:hypothetical protein
MAMMLISTCSRTNVSNDNPKIMMASPVGGSYGLALPSARPIIAKTLAFAP